jgi:4-amino-4-deoxychorismate lyase
MADRIVVIQGPGVVPSDTPLLRADDRGVLYGDGVFETLHLRPDGPWLLDAHLSRMAASARLLALPVPQQPALATLAHQAAAVWARQPEAEAQGGEGALRLVSTRGPAGGPPTLYATVGDVPETALRERRDGIRLITADLGVSAQRRPPWGLSGAKSLSYAANLAARRWATAQGADDVLWLSTEGYALEAPTASLVWLSGDTLCTVPPDEAPVLAGVTATHLLTRAGELGFRADQRMITGPALAEADAVWLASSLRGLAEAYTVDGASRTRSPHTAALQALLGFTA